MEESSWWLNPPREHINQAMGCCQHPQPPATPSKMIAALISCTSEGAKGSIGALSPGHHSNPGVLLPIGIGASLQTGQEALMSMKGAILARQSDCLET